MSISLGNALLSVKEDENWIKKTIIGGLIFIAYWISMYLIDNAETSTNKLIGLALYFIFLIFIWGFHASTGNKMINSASNTMADWTEKNLILKGLKILLGYLLYVFVFSTIFTIISVIILLAATIILGFVYYLAGLLLHVDFKTVSSGVIAGLVLAIIGIWLLAWFVQFTNAALTCYFKNLRFRDLMALKKQFRIVKENQHAAWTLLGKEILFGLLMILVILILTITIIGIAAIPFVCFMASIVSANLFAQYGKYIEIGRYLEE